MRELLQGALAIAAKDLAIEWRTRTAFVSSMTFWAMCAGTSS